MAAHGRWMRTRNAAPGREGSGRDGERGGARNRKGEFIPTSFVGVRRLEAYGQIPRDRTQLRPILPRIESHRATTS